LTERDIERVHFTPEEWRRDRRLEYLVVGGLILVVTAQIAFAIWWISGHPS
jgi:hypothetical protein